MLTPKEVQKALRRIETLRLQRANALAEIDGLVAVLRSAGLDGKCLASWDEIGDALGVVKQTVQERYKHLSWGGSVQGS